MFLGSPYDGICIGLKTCVPFVNIFKTCPPVMFLGSPYDGICIGLKTCVQGFVWVNIYPWCILCQGHG